MKVLYLLYVCTAHVTNVCLHGVSSRPEEQVGPGKERKNPVFLLPSANVESHLS